MQLRRTCRSHVRHAVGGRESREIVVLWRWRCEAKRLLKRRQVEVKAASAGTLLCERRRQEQPKRTSQRHQKKQVIHEKTGVMRDPNPLHKILQGGFVDDIFAGDSH